MSDAIRDLYATLQPGQMVWVQMGPHVQPQRLGFITGVGWDSVDVVYFPPAPHPPVVRLSGVWLLNDPRVVQQEQAGLPMGDRGFCQPAAAWLTPMNVEQRLHALEGAMAALRKSSQDRTS